MLTMDGCVREEGVIPLRQKYPRVHSHLCSRRVVHACRSDCRSRSAVTLSVHRELSLNESQWTP